MTSKQNAKLRMAQATAAMLSRYQTTWESLPAFAEAVTDLRDRLGQIETTLQTQTRRPQVATAEKEKALTELGELVSEIAGAVHAYAVVQGNQKLVEGLDLRRGQFLRPRDRNLVTRCLGVVEAATEHLDELGDYGVTAAKVNSLKKRLQAFQAATTRPRETVAARNAATTQLRGLFGELDTVLSQRLDKLVAQFRGANPGLCDEYSETRWIVHATRSRGRAADTAEGSAANPASDRVITPLVESATQAKAA